jgi:dGTPase
MSKHEYLLVIDRRMQMNEFINPLSNSEYEERLVHRDEDIRGSFFRDQTAILHSLPFRRMKHKAQVFFSPNNDHVCTRIEHSLHVATVAETIARALGLNGEMAYAIGLGHDLGHAPFGHAGETTLNKLTKNIGGFIHEMHGLRVVDILGNRGISLNLTYAVRDGIVCHCGESPDQEIEPRKEKKNISAIKKRSERPISYEGCIARMSDRISYLGRDLEDSIYGNFIKENEVPAVIKKNLGTSNGEIIDTLVIDVITNSKKTGKISLSDGKYEVLMELYKFSTEKIYKHPAIERYQVYCEKIIDQLFKYLLALMDTQAWDLDSYNNSRVPLDRRFGQFLKGMSSVYDTKYSSNMYVIRDYIAGMTDGYALRCMKEISLPDELYFENKYIDH